MHNYTTTIPLSVVNNYGEVEQMEAIIKSDNKNQAKGGWKMTYQTYSDILRELKSSNEINIMIDIQEHFTKSNKIAHIDKNKILKKYGITKQAYYRVIKKLIEIKFIKKLSADTYIMNPFAYVPYQANAKELQDEWAKI